MECPSLLGGWRKKPVWSIHAMEYDSSLARKGSLTQAAAWINLRKLPDTKGQKWHGSMCRSSLKASDSEGPEVEQWALGAGAGDADIGTEFQFFKMKGVMGTDGGDSCTR